MHVLKLELRVVPVEAFLGALGDQPTCILSSIIVGQELRRVAAVIGLLVVSLLLNGGIQVCELLLLML